MSSDEYHIRKLQKLLDHTFAFSDSVAVRCALEDATRIARIQQEARIAFEEYHQFQSAVVKMATEVQRTQAGWQNLMAQVAKAFEPYLREVAQLQRLFTQVARDIQPEVVHWQKLISSVPSVDIFYELTRRYEELKNRPGIVPEEALIEEVEGQVAKAQQDPMVILSLLQWFITLLAFFATSHMGVQMEKRIMERIETLETTLSTTVEQLKQPSTVETWYVVQRHLNLHAQPTTSSTKLGVLYPQQIVRLVERRSKWIRVEYYDHIEGKTKTGWAYKKYLKRVARK